MNNLWDLNNHSANILLLIAIHLYIFIVTSIVTTYKITKNIKKALLTTLQESKAPMISEASILIYAIRSIFGVNINISYIYEILFTLFFCFIIINGNMGKSHFNARIFLTGQIILVVFIGCILFADLLM